jgi:hypothetical protein
LSSHPPLGLQSGLFPSGFPSSYWYCRIWGSHRHGYEEFYLLQHNAVYSDESQPTLWRNMLPSSTGLKLDIILIIKSNTDIFTSYNTSMPITVAALSKAWNLVAQSNAGIVGSNPNLRYDVCVCVYSVFLLSCV